MMNGVRKVQRDAVGKLQNEADISLIRYEAVDVIEMFGPGYAEAPVVRPDSYDIRRVCLGRNNKIVDSQRVVVSNNEGILFH